jgi:hypothetical protein
VASMEDLLRAFEPMLVPIVIDQIRATLDALRDSVLGVETALLPSLGSVFQNIMLDLKNRAHVPAAHGDGLDLGWSQVPERQRSRRGQRGGRADL